MARSCTVCSRTDSGTINELLAGGRSARSVAGELGLSHRALLRHAQNHIGHVVVASPERSAPRPRTAPITDPLDELTAALRLRALAGNPADTREYRLALQAQTAARHAAAPTRDLASEPEWIELRSRMLAALEDEPTARMKIADALAVTGMD